MAVLPGTVRIRIDSPIARIARRTQLGMQALSRYRTAGIVRFADKRRQKGLFSLLVMVEKAATSLVNADEQDHP